LTTQSLPGDSARTLKVLATTAAKLKLKSGEKLGNVIPTIGSLRNRQALVLTASIQWV
jgi:hypothetical protein